MYNELYKDFGSIGNLAAALNSKVEFENLTGLSSIAFYLSVPLGSTVTFESSFDGINFSSATMRGIGTNGYTHSASLSGDFIGSILGAKIFRVRVSIAGTAAGTIMGRVGNQVGILEGIEHSSAPHLYGYETAKKDFDFVGAQTAQILWDPGAGKKFVVSDIVLSSNGNAAVTIFDETNSAGNIIYKGKLINGTNIPINLRVPIESIAYANKLKFTSVGVGDVSGVIVGYEIIP